MKISSLFPPLEKLQRFLLTPTGRRWFRVATRGIGAAAIASFIWVATPFIGFGSVRPFADALPRLLAIFAELIVIAIVIFQDVQRRKSSADHLATALGSEDNDAPVLAERMKGALSVLRSRAGGRTNYLYDLPWYVLIGPPGSGKTTALVNSGLKFPLLKGGRPDAIAGVGGTRYCDWWFTEDAVLIDTAGRYTTQDSDATADQTSWRAFLDLLRRYRPRQPINGVLLVISLEDILTLSPQEIAAHAEAVRTRIIELNRQLDLDFPVYALFTKADLIVGFMEFFDDLDERGRAQVWGTTFRSKQKRQNPLDAIESEFDALVARVHDAVPGKLETEKDAAARVLVFGFPTQFAALKQQIVDMLTQIFDPSLYHAGAPLRGFYFTSGTQEGTPIDKLLGALSKSFAAEGVSSPVYSGRGKSFFLTNLVKNVVIGEAGFVSNNIARKIGAAASFLMLFIVTPLVIGFFLISYAHNSDLIQDSRRAASRYTALYGPLATSSDRDPFKVLPALEALHNLGSRSDTPDANSDLGLDQQWRLHSAAETAYRNGLERLLRPRLISRVEDQLRAKADKPDELYDTLKVYLMLGRLKPADREFLLGWMEDWAKSFYPDQQYAQQRRDLQTRIAAMIDLDNASQPAIVLNGTLVETSQRTLAKINVADRAFDLLQKGAEAERRDPWRATVGAGGGGLNFFDDTLRDVTVPYFYTRAGFEKAFLGRLDRTIEAATRDRWLFGASGDRLATQFDQLPQALAKRYSDAALAAWQSALGKLAVRNLVADRPNYQLLANAGVVPSPLATLLESIRDQTYLSDVPEIRTTNAAGATAADTIANGMRDYHKLVTGTAASRPIDKIVTDLREVQKALTAKARASAPDEQLTRRASQKIDALAWDTDSLPLPFRGLLKTVVNDARQESAK